MSCIHRSLQWTFLCLRIDITRLLVGEVTMRSHSSVTVNERTVGKIKRGIHSKLHLYYMQARRSMLWSSLRRLQSDYKLLRHQRQENKQQTFSAASKTQATPLYTYFSIYLQSDLYTRRNRVWEASNSFWGQNFFAECHPAFAEQQINRNVCRLNHYCLQLSHCFEW